MGGLAAGRLWHGGCCAVRFVAVLLGVQYTIARPALRCAGEAYAATAAAASIVALWGSGAGWSAALAAVMLAPLAVCFAGASARSAASARGAWREERERTDVADRLWELGKEYKVLPGLCVSPGREDHVAIGPNGVFVVMTCGGGGRVTASARRLYVDGRLPERDVLDDCRMDARRVGERMRRMLGRDLPVHPVVCFARGLVVAGQDIMGVKVVHASRLARLVASTSATRTLAESEIDAAVLALVTAPAGEQTAPPARRVERRLALVARAPAQNLGGGRNG